MSDVTGAARVPSVDGGGDRSLGQLVSSATAELSALFQDEIALAKAELRQDVKRAGIGGAAGGVAAVLAMFALPLLGFAAAYGIHNLGLGLAWSFLIVGAAYLVIAGALGVFALRAFKRVRPPERSIASSKQTVEAIKQTKPHPRAEVKPSPRAEVTDRAALH